MIAQEFGFTEDFAKEWSNSVYSRLNKIFCIQRSRKRTEKGDKFM